MVSRVRHSYPKEADKYSHKNQNQTKIAAFGGILSNHQPCFCPNSNISDDGVDGCRCWTKNDCQ